jgi:hypothetical protein
MMGILIRSSRSGTDNVLSDGKLYRQKGIRGIKTLRKIQKARLIVAIEFYFQNVG